MAHFARILNSIPWFSRKSNLGNEIGVFSRFQYYMPLHDVRLIFFVGTEPDSIHEVMEAIDPLVLGQTLTGAGGGGFLVLITKEPNMADKVKAVIQEKKVAEVSFVQTVALKSTCAERPTVDCSHFYHHLSSKMRDHLDGFSSKFVQYLQKLFTKNLLTAR